MSTHLIDTNILIYYLNGDIPTENTVIDDLIQTSFNISVLTKIEFLSWSEFLEHEVELEKAEEFISYASVIYLDGPIVRRTIEIRRKHKMKLADSVIAATAFENDMTLVTRNVSDFRMDDLPMYNPFTDNLTEHE